MKTNVKDTDRRLEELTAFIDALSGTNNSVRSVLEGNDDSIRYRLSIMLDSKEYDKATNLIQGRPIHEKWCDLAIKALVCSGDREGAVNVLEEVRKKFSSDQEPLRLRCMLAYASTLFESAFSDRSDIYVLRGSLTESEAIAMREVLSSVSEVEERLIRDKAIKTKLELNLASLARKAHFLLGNHDEHRRLAELLLTYTPVSIELSQDIRNDLIPCPEDFPERLRRDHPDTIQALFDACLIEAEKLNRPYEALAHALDLSNKVKRKDEKRFLAEFLSQLSSSMEDRERNRSLDAIRKLLGEDSSEYAFIKIEELVREERYDEALARLENIQDVEDPIWLQIYGHALIGVGRQREAADAFFKASQKLVHPDVLRKAADLSFREKEWGQAKASFYKLMELNPDDPQVLHNLGSLHAQLREYDQACSFFTKLNDVEPDEIAHKVNLAYCQKENGLLEESLSTYESIEGDPPDLTVLLGKAEVLRGLGRVDDAFRSLFPFKDAYWSEPAFVAHWLDLAYAAGEEEEGHEAMQSMVTFSQKGLIDKNAFRALHSDEAIEVIKESFRKTEQQRQHMYREMLQGRMPWIWSSQTEGNATYWAWRLRTQKFDWVGDDPVNRASNSIYATNGFHPKKEGELISLETLEASSHGSPVVADLSSLISLHRLGLLNEAIEYFGEVLIPQAYLQTVLEDGRKMVLHQRTQKLSAERILQLISSGTLQTLNPSSNEHDGFALVDEHSLEGCDCYPLLDLVQPVYDEGLLEDAEYERVKQVCHKESILDEDHPKLNRLQSIWVSLSTLQTLSTFGVLNEVSGFYRIYILQSEQTELTGRINGIRTQEETREWHFELWDKLRENDRVRFVPHVIPSEMLEEGMEPKELLSFLSVFVARERKLPLMADDRVCHAFLLNTSEAESAYAFGTDAVIRALVANRRFDEAMGVDAFLTLMGWRYRFLVPPAAMLKNLALRYKRRLPGKPLREVAEYLHDCMRDAGLFGGPENTTPPASMASKYYLTWMQVLADFLVEVWLEDEFETPAKETLTRWCIHELMPSYPRVMHGGQKITIADSSNRLLLSYMLINVKLVTGGKWASEALKAVQSALHLSNEDYLRIVTGVLDDAERTKA